MVCHFELVIYAYTTCPRGGLWILDPRKLILRGEGESTGKSSRIMQLSKSSWLPFSRERDATRVAEAQTKRRAAEFSRTHASVNLIGGLCNLFFGLFWTQVLGPKGDFTNSVPGPCRPWVKKSPAESRADETACEQEAYLSPRPPPEEPPDPPNPIPPPPSPEGGREGSLRSSSSGSGSAKASASSTHCAN